MILGLRPEHISCYSLQIEEGTPFGDMADSGELTEVPDEEDRRTYHEICRVLREAGYEHYEISNFARRDPADPDGPSQYRSKHNSLYWDMSDYIGLGLGASGFTDGRRYKNTSDIQDYMDELSSGRLPECEEPVNSPFDNISEAVFTGLRRAEGIRYAEAIDAYMDRSCDSPPVMPRDEFWRIFAEAKGDAEEYAAQGLLVIDDDGLRLTEQGIDISNRIMSLFV